MRGEIKKMDVKVFKLLDKNRKFYESEVAGLFGGYRPKKIYGRLNCFSARNAIDKGGYVKHRVFFADELTAKAAGYRPCGNCMPIEYAAWKARQPA